MHIRRAARCVLGVQWSLSTNQSITFSTTTRGVDRKKPVPAFWMYVRSLKPTKGLHICDHTMPPVRVLYDALLVGCMLLPQGILWLAQKNFFFAPCHYPSIFIYHLHPSPFKHHSFKAANPLLLIYCIETSTGMIWVWCYHVFLLSSAHALTEMTLISVSAWCVCAYPYRETCLELCFQLHLHIRFFGNLNGCNAWLYTKAPRKGVLPLELGLYVLVAAVGGRICTF